MNPNYGYQLYQAQRVTPRAEILAADAQRGRQAAAARRWSRRLARATLGQLAGTGSRPDSPFSRFAGLFHPSHKLAHGETGDGWPWTTRQARPGS
jgi:hypothetical protein